MHVTSVLNIIIKLKIFSFVLLFQLSNFSCNFRCSSMEITAYSVPLEWELLSVPINELIEPFFNPLLLLMFIILLFFYIIVLYLNFQQDEKRNLTLTPLPLKDNNTKHKQLYLMCVKTGMYFNSGTTASVSDFSKVSIF